MPSLHGLALFCGMFLATLRRADSVDFVSTNMRGDLFKLKEHFKTGDKTLFRQPVFLKNLHNFTSEFTEGEQKLLFNEVLEVYIKILSSLMNRTEDGNMRTSIRRTRDKMHELRRNYFQGKEHLKRILLDLWSIQTDDQTIQRKALRELMVVYQKASVVGSKIQRRKENLRRSRQLHKQHL